jgi:hypothetical protein
MRQCGEEPAEFIKLPTKPGSMSYASTGNGSGLHLSMELLKSMAGIDLVHVLTRAVVRHHRPSARRRCS